MLVTGGFACFIKLVQGKLSGMIGTYVDDSIDTGDIKFEEESRPTERAFDSRKGCMIRFFSQESRYRRLVTST